MLCNKTMTREGCGNCGFFIFLSIYSNKLAYLQLITVLVERSSPPKSHEQGYLNFSKNLEEYVRMNSFLELATLLKLF